MKIRTLVYAAINNILFKWRFMSCSSIYPKYTEALFSNNTVISFRASGDFCCLLITFANSLDPDQNICPDLDSNCLIVWLCSLKNFLKKIILKKSADNNKSMKNWPACKEVSLRSIFTSSFECKCINRKANSVVPDQNHLQEKSWIYLFLQDLYF